MGKGPKAQGQPSLWWWPKASLLCDTQVRKDGVLNTYDHVEDDIFSIHKSNKLILANTIPCTVKNVIN